jgi:restriction endonuclease S subunit
MINNERYVLKFDQLVERITEVVDPKESNIDKFIGPEHIDPMSANISRWDEGRDLTGKKFIVKKGDIIFAKRRWYLRRVGIAPLTALCSAHTLIFRPKKENIFPDFLPYFLLAEHFYQKGIEISVGSLSPTINWTQLKGLDVEVPSLDYQKKFTKIFTTIESTLSLYDQLLQNINTLISKLNHQLFTTFPRDFLISDFCYVDSSNITSQHIETNGAWTYYDLSSIGPTNDLRDGLNVNIGDAPSRARRIVQNRDVLISTVRPLQKKHCVFDKQGDNMVASTGFCNLRPHLSSHSNLILGLFLSPQFTQFAKSRQKGSSYPAITSGDVKEFKIPNIYSEELDVYNKLFSELFDQEKNLRNNIDILNRLKTGLFQKMV